MNNDLSTTNSTKNLPLFFVIVFLIALPFYLLAYLVGGDLVTLVTLPLTAAPIIAGLILTYRENGVDTAKELITRAFDYKRITNKIWYIPILFFWPILFTLGSFIFAATGESAPEPLLPLIAAPVALVLFFLLTLFEEVGWMGYAFEPMEKRWKALNAGLILGVIWALWHLPLYIFAGREPKWIIGQLVTLVATRILIVFIFNNTGKSVFATIQFHAVYNLCALITINYSTTSGHLITTLLVVLCTFVVILLWDSSTLTRFRFRKVKPEA